MGFEGRGRSRRRGFQPCSEVLHERRDFGRVRKDNGRTGDPARKPAVNASNARLAARNNAPVQLAHRVLADGLRRLGERAHP